MADRAGIEFMLPIGRWKGYGGLTDYQGETWETVSWACGLLAKTRRLIVFGTVHAPLIPPLIAAKEFVTADHIGEGRFGLNLVCGWNEGEFEMFGATLRDHQARYEYARGMARYRQARLVGARGVRFRRAFLQVEGGAVEAQALWRNPAVDHECRRLGDRPGLRDRQLRRAVLERYRAASHSRRPRVTSRACGPWRSRRAGRSKSIPSGSSPAGLRRGRRRTITGTPSSTMPIGRRSTTFWR